MRVSTGKLKIAIIMKNFMLLIFLMTCCRQYRVEKHIKYEWLFFYILGGRYSLLRAQPNRNGRQNKLQ